MLSLKSLFSDMGFFPNDDQLEELLASCGRKEGDDEISFELFARSMALLLEESNKEVRENYQEGDESYN